MARASDTEDIYSLNPKSITTVKMAFDKKLKEKQGTLGLQVKKDEEVWLGNPQHPVGYFKKVGINNYKIIGDGMWLFIASKVVNIKAIEEVVFD